MGRLVNDLSPERIRRLLAKHDKDNDIVLKPPWGSSANIWAAEIRKVLDAHYPKWRWAVGIWIKDGIAIIKNLDIQTDWSIVLRLDDVDYPNFKIVMRLAGEFLERCGLATTPNVTPEHVEFSPKLNRFGDVKLDITAIPKSNL